jgi:hypothetical protein
MAQNIIAERFADVQGEFQGQDALGRTYTVSDNTFTMKSESGSVDFRDLSLGRLSKVDLKNPLSILLFYENFNTVVLLDQLSEIRRVSFSELKEQVVATAAGTAARNRLWVYDSLKQRLGFYEHLNNRFVPITPVLTGGIQSYTSDYNYFYWIDDKGKFWSCDQFGKITLQATVGPFDSIQIIGPTMYIYSKAGELFIKDIQKGQQYLIENVEKSFSTFGFKDQILSIFTNGSITNYKIITP